MNCTFEEAMARLEEISNKLSNEEMSLEDSIKLYSEGVELLAFCNEKINQASLVVKQIQTGVADEK